MVRSANIYDICYAPNKFHNEHFITLWIIHYSLYIWIFYLRNWFSINICVHHSWISSSVFYSISNVSREGPRVWNVISFQFFNSVTAACKTQIDHVLSRNTNESTRNNKYNADPYRTKCKKVLRAHRYSHQDKSIIKHSLIYNKIRKYIFLIDDTRDRMLSRHSNTPLCVYAFRTKSCRNACRTPAIWPANIFRRYFISFVFVIEYIYSYI